MPRFEGPFTGVTADGYAGRAARSVPGLAGLHRMVGLLLAEQVAAEGHLLVLGAGGGLELKALAGMQAGWRFTGVDPSPDMLAVAGEVCAGFAGRVTLIEGVIGDAPPGPFDGAVSLLTFHFIPREARLETLRALHARLKPGAPFVMAHLSCAGEEPARSRWIARHVAYGAVEGTDPAQMERSRRALAAGVHVLAPEEEEAMLAEAGFGGVEMFYAGFALRGWVARA
jgi:tRNA (cmo5U34)-methyltransferase